MSENESTNLRIWDALKTPPDAALKKIEGGRMSGSTNINAQWRLRAMTEQFGPVGVGWRYTIKKLWTEAVGSKGEVAAFAEVDVFIRSEEYGIKSDSGWSEAIPGIGGNQLVQAEKGGLHVNDECYKMAVTDALSVAFKALGVAAEVYLGMFDDKYSRPGGGGGQRPKRQPTDQGCGNCPKCGIFLAKRKRNDGSGSFLSCQGYPKCKYSGPLPKDGAAKAAPPEQRPGPRPVKAPPAAAQEAEEMCHVCGNHTINPDGFCPSEHGAEGAAQGQTPEELGVWVEPEGPPRCCDRNMMPRAGFSGEPPLWGCPRCKAKKAMTDEERKRVGL